MISYCEATLQQFKIMKYDYMYELKVQEMTLLGVKHIARQFFSIFIGNKIILR